MPSENMDQGRRHLGSSSFFSEDNCFSHRQIGMRKPEPATEHSDSSGLSMTSWRAGAQYFGPRTDLCVQPPPHIVDTDTVGLNGIHYENSFPSNSVSEAFDKQLKLAPKGFSLGEYVNTVDQNFGKQKRSDSLEECEVHSLACLLPDDDLLTGVFDDQEYVAQPSAGDDTNEDIFPYDGEMNFEADDNISSNKTSGSLGGFFLADQQGSLNTLYANGHSYSEHPSRTLFVRNINASVDDAELRTLFEQYGDIRSLYTGCKHRGFVMVSYYDIRAAMDAMRALQKKSLSHWKLDIHFSIPKDNSSEKDTNEGTLVIFNLDSFVSHDDIRQIFGVYGGIRQIRETPNKHHHKFIEFYDVRAAEAALQGLNGSMIGGKKIKLETSHLGGARRCLTQQLELKESNGRPGIPNNSPSGCYGIIPLGALNSAGLDIRAVQGSRSANRAPASPFMGAAFRGVSSRIQSMSSPIRVASVCSQNDMLGRRELIHSPGQTNFVVQQLPNFPPHTLPGYAVGFPHGLHNSSTMSTMGIKSRPSEGINTRYINNAGFSSINSNAFERNEGAFGDSGNETYPLHAHPCTWNSSRNYYHQPRGPMMWSSGPVFVNTFPSHPLQQVHGLPGVLSPTMKAVRPLQQRKLSSEITENPLFLRLQRAFQDDPTDPPAIHPGSPGSKEPSGNCPIHTQEHISHNNIHAGGDCTDPTHVGSPAHVGSPVHVGSPAPRQRCHFSRRKTPYDMSNDQAEKYELDIERISRGEDSRTTLMIKNIPNKYTSKMLLGVIDELNKGTYDFLYLPIDFKNKCNVGYAFINMMDSKQIVPFYQAFHGKKWDKFNSEKVASLAYARIQGKVALVSHFQNSSLMNEDKRCRPILFHSDGPNAGVQEPFPVGDNIRSRPGRVRTADYEESPEGSPPTPAHEDGEHIGTSYSASSAGFE